MAEFLNLNKASTLIASDGKMKYKCMANHGLRLHGGTRLHNP